MTKLLAEQPVLLAIVLAVLGVGCLYGWLQSGKRAALLAGALFFVLIPLGFWIAANWETDRERITALVYETALAVEQNDADKVAAVIAPELEEIRRLATSEMSNYEFKRAQVGQIRSLVFNQNAVPLEAQVDITANVTVRARSGAFGEQEVSRRLILRFQKRDDRWLVVDYTHLPVIGGPDGFSPHTDLTKSYRDF
ncbi:hypothetical protein FF011L_23650 [Roseimaritima multifibrata]|uniref:Tim44-like domain protein n=1 Tax=Roseimaritima multifibrata TaxID=1930274 RepID=A0A517MFC5_9BACT|nr:hypothetical protein [Roseimaritima multifibrata]QDS93592.1 hypothetical protein FF011L_23650 [Roseimaritima multifibrata]